MSRRVLIARYLCVLIYPHARDIRSKYVVVDAASDATERFLF